MCSTPFGIGEEVMRPSVESRCQVSRVLNAFRHRRRGHAPVRRGLRRQQDVLNAFRHRRRGHATICMPIGSWRRVLNAFRHRRRGHDRGDVGAAMQLVCSTPFGIGEEVIWWIRRTGIGCWRAQRLSASEKRSWRSRRVRRPFGYGAQRLSASEKRSCVVVDHALPGRAGCSTPFGIGEEVIRDRECGA